MRERRAVRDAENSVSLEQLPKAPVSARTPRGELPVVPSPAKKSSRESETRPPSMADERYMPSRGLFAQTLRADRHFLQADDEIRVSRVRGPAEVRAARERPSSSADRRKEEEALSGEAKGADFRTLHEMIAKGIIESETGASKMEATLKADDDEEELRRHRELVRRQRAEAEEARQKEREQARMKRQKDWDEQQRRIRLEVERETQTERLESQPDSAKLRRCKEELAAVSRIQAVFRGHRSRRGQVTASPAVCPTLHAEPFQKPKVFDLE